MTNTAVLQVERAGPLVTIQDGGRPRMMRYGIPASGPMDTFAHAAANTVLGRPPRSTAIEVSLGGLSLVCRAGPVTVSVCGGGFTITHAKQRCSSWTVCTLHDGEGLTIAAGGWGSWCYLAVAGDLVAASWLGSASTHVRSELGGGPLRTGTNLNIDNTWADDARDGPVDVPEVARPTRTLRAVLGPQLHCFHADAADRLTSSRYTFTTAYDRMGVRLDGPPLELREALAIPSTPIVRGSVQVAGDGVPTLLFADHQTTGGYPKIATVVTDDARRATQLRAGDSVQFTPIDPADAVHVARLAAQQRQHHLVDLADRPGLRTRRLLQTNLIDGVFHPNLTSDEETTQVLAPPGSPVDR